VSVNLGKGVYHLNLLKNGRGTDFSFCADMLQMLCDKNISDTVLQIVIKFLCHAISGCSSPESVDSLPSLNLEPKCG